MNREAEVWDLALKHKLSVLVPHSSGWGKVFCTGYKDCNVNSTLQSLYLILSTYLDKKHPFVIASLILPFFFPSIDKAPPTVPSGKAIRMLLNTTHTTSTITRNICNITLTASLAIFASQFDFCRGQWQRFHRFNVTFTNAPVFYLYCNTKISFSDWACVELPDRQ